MEHQNSADLCSKPPAGTIVEEGRGLVRQLGSPYPFTEDLFGTNTNLNAPGSIQYFSDEGELNLSDEDFSWTTPELPSAVSSAQIDFEPESYSDAGVVESTESKVTADQIFTDQMYRYLRRGWKSGGSEVRGQSGHRELSQGNLWQDIVKWVQVLEAPCWNSVPELALDTNIFSLDTYLTETLIVLKRRSTRIACTKRMYRVYQEVWYSERERQALMVRPPRPQRRFAELIVALRYADIYYEQRAASVVLREWRALLSSDIYYEAPTYDEEQGHQLLQLVLPLGTRKRTVSIHALQKMYNAYYDAVVIVEAMEDRIAEVHQYALLEIAKTVAKITRTSDRRKRILELIQTHKIQRLHCDLSELDKKREEQAIRARATAVERSHPHIC